MLYLVSYTLNPNREVPRLEEELKWNATWWHHLDYTWIIATDQSINDFYTRLAIRFNDSDSFIIVQFHPNAVYRGWLPQIAWDWLNSNRNK